MAVSTETIHYLSDGLETHYRSREFLQLSLRPEVYPEMSKSRVPSSSNKYGAPNKARLGLTSYYSCFVEPYESFIF